MSEKRKQRRFKIYQLIQMTIGKEKYVACEGINISRSGMLVKINQKIDASARFYILFEVPLKSGTYEIRCEGMVAHTQEVEDGYEAGVTFTDLFEEDQKVLDRYILELEEKES